MWTRDRRRVVIDNLDANRTVTFGGKCDEGADPISLCAPWISPGPIHELLPSSIRDIVCNINKKKRTAPCSCFSRAEL